MKFTHVWDDNVAGWMMRVQNYVMSSGGILWTPDILDTDGNKKVSVKNSFTNRSSYERDVSRYWLKLLPPRPPQDALNAKDFATLTSAILISSDPATQTTLAELLAKVIAPAHRSQAGCFKC